MLMEAPPSADGLPLKPTKKSLFNRPAGRKALPQAASTPETIFERSKSSFDAILAERQQKQKAKEEREKEQQQATKEHELDARGSRKKRRLSEDTDGENGNDSQSQFDTRKISPSNTRIHSAETPQNSQTSPQRAQKRHSTPNEPSNHPVRSTSEVIDLGSGSDAKSDAEHLQPVEKPSESSKKKPQQSRGEDSDSAEEFPELAAAARARARRRELEVASYGKEKDTKPVAEENKSFSTAQINPSSPEIPDPVVQLLITSPITGTSPLIVRRKLSQRLQEVRFAWCARQQFPTPITEADVFLTWRGRRIFDVTSCKSLGIAVDPMGTVFIPGQNMGFGNREVEGLKEDDENGAVKVHLEAVTQEILELLKNERVEKKSQQDQLTMSGRSGDEEAGLDAGAEAEQHHAKEAQVRIILKAKGLADYKIIVKPTTKILQIVQAAKKAFKTIDGQGVFIEFDGDRLRESDMVHETEVSDLDVLDVHIK